MFGTFRSSAAHVRRFSQCRWSGKFYDKSKSSLFPRQNHSSSIVKGKGNNHNQYTSRNDGRIPPYIWLSCAGTAVTVGYFYYSYLDEVPISKRKRWIATSPEWECEMGDREYKELLRMYRNDILPSDHRASITVQRVGSRIVKAANEFMRKHNITTTTVSNNKNSRQQPYTYTVVRSDTANAFVLPNNHVFVMTGLFRYIQNEDDLAAVLGHEMAHNIARHVGEKVSGSVIVSMLARFTLLWDPSGTLFSVFLPAAALFRDLPHSRVQETEADQIGVYLAAEACYDPRAAKRVFQAMKDHETRSSSSAPPEFLSTHPSHDTRISNFDDWMPQAMNTYNEDGGNRCHHVRKEMEMARKNAAQQATLREKKRLG